MVKKQIIISLIMIAVLVFPLGFAVSQSETPDTFIFIESRFILWDSNEKMLDNNFTITMFNLNASMNNTYKLTINQNISWGNFSGFVIIPVNVTDELINIHIELNGKPFYTISGIRIISGVTGNGIDNIQKPFTWNLSPLEWDKKQWNIFYGIVCAAFISVLVSYKIVIYYRKLNGVQEIK